MTPQSINECLEDIDVILEAMERVKRRLMDERPDLYERWKAGGLIVDADVITTYPSLHDISQQLMDERDGDAIYDQERRERDQEEED